MLIQIRKIDNLMVYKYRHLDNLCHQILTLNFHIYFCKHFWKQNVFEYLNYFWGVKISWSGLQ